MTSPDQVRRTRTALAVGLALAGHAGAAWVVAKSPAPVVVPPREPERMVVQWIEETPAPPPPKPPPPKPEPPKPKPPPPKLVELPPPVVADVLPKPAAPAPAPKRVRPKSSRPEAARPAAAPALRVEGAAATGSVRTYEGAEATFGSPEVPATPENDGPDRRPSGEGPPGSDGTGGAGQAVAPSAPAPEGVVVAPKVKVRVIGEYPAGAPRTGRAVAMTLKLEIDAIGRVIAARIVSRPPIAGAFFDKEALRVARATAFEPATRDGKAVPFSIRYVVKFEP